MGDMAESTIGLARGIAEDAAHLVSTEIKLAKAEVKSNIAALGRPVALLAVAAILSIGALLALLACAIAALATGMEVWLAALIVAAVVGIAAAIALSSGLGGLKSASLAPQRVQQSVHQDIAAIKGE